MFGPGSGTIGDPGKKYVKCKHCGVTGRVKGNPFRKPCPHCGRKGGISLISSSEAKDKADFHLPRRKK